MKLDIRGYFMHINRSRLLDITTGTLDRMRRHRISKDKTETWEDRIDMNLVEWLTRKIVLLDPNENCIVIGKESDWTGLDPEKTMRKAGSGIGMPIGNLTSQLFSNVYLNVFDQFMKRVMGCRHYGRYVDDAYVVSHDKEWLLSIVPHIRDFIGRSLCLELHMGKLSVAESRYGTEFLGAYVKPYRTYASNDCIRRMLRNIGCMKTDDKERVYKSVNSFLGVLSHHKTYRIRRRMFLKKEFLDVSTFSTDMKKMNKPDLFTNKNIL